MTFHIDYIPDDAAKVFNKLAQLSFLQKFTLVGGTALSLRLGHRQSEDLDFIYDGEKIPANSIKREIARNFSDYRLIREEKDYQLDFLISNVKITFFSSGAVLVPFTVKDFSEKHQNLNIATIEIIAVLKIATISQRNTIRDYYDLYYIARHIIPLSKMIEKSREMLPNISPITYTETIIYTADIAENSIENHLKPKEIVTKEQIAEYFIEELKKLRAK